VHPSMIAPAPAWAAGLGLVDRLNRPAGALGLQIHILPASTEGEIDRAFADLSQLPASALFVGAGELFMRRRDQLVVLAAQQRVPAICQYRESLQLAV